MALISSVKTLSDRRAPSSNMIAIFILAFMITLSLLWLFAPQKLTAQALLNHNSNAPVTFDAANIKFLDQQNQVLLTGNVVINQAGMTIRSSRMIIDYRNNNGIEIDQINATGGVTVVKADESASGDSGIYDFNRRIITMIGDVKLRQSGNTLNGGRLVINLDSGQALVDGRASGTGASNSGASGRVSGSFKVPERK